MDQGITSDVSHGVILSGFMRVWSVGFSTFKGLWLKHSKDVNFSLTGTLVLWSIHLRFCS